MPFQRLTRILLVVALALFALSLGTLLRAQAFEYNIRADGKAYIVPGSALAPTTPNGPPCTDSGWYQRVCDMHWQFISASMPPGTIVPSGCGSHHELVYDDTGAQVTLIGQCPDPAHPCAGTQNLYKKPDHPSPALDRWNYYYTVADALLHRTVFHYYGPGAPPPGLQILTPYRVLANVPDPPRAAFIQAYGCTVTTPTPAATPVPTPVPTPAANPFAPQIEALSDAGITAGCGGGNFCPKAYMTREQMAAWLAKGLKLQINACRGLFKDVPCPLPGFKVTQP